MAGFFNVYNTTSTGIAKGASEKKRITVFFGILTRKFWRLISLNFLYVLCCLPIVTIGPATAGAIKVLKNFSIEKNAFVFEDFVYSFKKNFKNSFIIGLLDLVATVIFSLCFYVYPTMGNQTGNFIWYALYFITICISAVILIMNFYIFLMIVSTDISFKNIIKNSFALVFIATKKNLITILLTVMVSALFYFIITINYLFLILLLFMPATLIGLIICFNCYPVIQKQVINPYYEQKGEDNPEYDYLKPASEEDMLFQDIEGNEMPVDEKKVKKTRGKTIS